MGASTTDFFRLFMMPGVFHCSGGVGPASFDTLAQLIPWVERGQAPQRIVAAQVESGAESGKVLRTRPLCPYPETAQYRGQGDINDEANFRCVDVAK
jgi:feruloyl esterase